MTANLIILTPAVIRLNIHEKGIINFINIIKKSTNIRKKKFQIKLFINFDIYEYNKEEEIKECIQSITDLAEADFLDIIIFKNKKPCFSEAFKRLLNESNNYINKLNINKEDTIFLWMEDDWNTTEERFNNIVEPNLLSFYKDDSTEFLNLVELEPSGPPFFFKSAFYNLLVNHISNVNIKNKFNRKDPEKIIIFVYRNNKDKLNKIIHIGNRDQTPLWPDSPHIIVRPELSHLPVIFTDAGKYWKKDNKLKKWNKYTTTTSCKYV